MSVDLQLWPSATRRTAQSILLSLWKYKRNKSFSSDIRFEIELAALASLLKPRSISEKELFRLLCNYDASEPPLLEHIESHFFANESLIRITVPKAFGQWTLYLPTNLQVDRSQYGIACGAKQFRSGLVFGQLANERWHQLWRTVDASERARDAYAPYNWQTPISLLIIGTHAASYEEALERLWNHYAELAGLFELTLSARGWTKTFGGLSHAKVRYGDTFVVTGPQQTSYASLIGYAVDTRSLPRVRPLPTRLSATRLQWLKHILSTINSTRVDDSLRSIISNALGLYYSAQEQPCMHDRFLYWWRVAECITLCSGAGGSTHEVRKRLGFMAYHGMAQPDASDIALNHAAALRNEYVHTGDVGGISEDRGNALKYHIDCAMLWLLGYAEYISNRNVLVDVLKHCKLSSTDRATLRQSIDVLDRVDRNRSHS